MAGFEPIAEAWIAHVREQSDHWYRHNAEAFLDLLPPPGRATLDVGCGEGRLGRELIKRGHHVIGVELSPTLAAHAREAYEVIEADAAARPFEHGSFDLVIAFMSLMDIDDTDRAVTEAARVLEPGGRFCAALVHPVLSAGDGEPFTIRGSYLEPYRYRGRLRASGLEIEGLHRPLEAYARALEAAGLLIEALRELPAVPPDITPPASSRGMSKHWELEAENWLKWTRTPNHDAYWYYRDLFFELVVAYNSLMDVEDMPGAVREAARVLEPGGRFCFCVTHPLMDAGRFESREPDAAFVIEGSYFGRRRYEGTFERDGLEITFRGWCYPLEGYTRALEEAGFLLEAIREPSVPDEDVRSRRIPLFLFGRTVKP